MNQKTEKNELIFFFKRVLLGQIPLEQVCPYLIDRPKDHFLMLVGWFGIIS